MHDNGLLGESKTKRFQLDVGRIIDNGREYLQLGKGQISFLGGK